ANRAFGLVRLNARQSIEAHQPKGSIRVTTELAGLNVRVTIQDNGPGIAEENLSKIFDPFFTTKEVGKGTGLGLSLCYGIIQEHGGTIQVLSKPNEGATFLIALPIATDLADVDKTITHVKPAMPAPSGQGKRALIV